MFFVFCLHVCLTIRSIQRDQGLPPLSLNFEPKHGTSMALSFHGLDVIVQLYTQVAGPAYVPDKSYELLNRITGGGLQVHYKFTRRAHISSEKMLAIELTFKNTSDSPLSNISIGDTRLQSGMSMKDTNSINQLAPGSSTTLTVGVNFNDTLQPAKFDIW